MTKKKKRGYVKEQKHLLWRKRDLYVNFRIIGEHYKEGMFVLGDEEKEGEEVFALCPNDLSIPVLCIQNRVRRVTEIFLVVTVKHLLYLEMKIQGKCMD